MPEETVAARTVAPVVAEAPAEPATPIAEPEDGSAVATLVEADLLVEDVSIDGMCGVY